jgi:anti-sigma factor RsiW
MSCELWSERLDVYVDDEASREEGALLEAHLRDCAKCTREALSRMQLKRATQAAAMRFTPPPELRPRIERSIRNSGRPRLAPAWTPGLLALAALLLLAVAASFVSLRAPARQDTFAEIVDTHVATLASTNPVDVISTDRHTVKPWFQGKLPFSFNLPEFAGTDFRLVGGRIAYIGGRPAAQLLIAAGKHEISVFLEQYDRTGGPRLPDASTTHVQGFVVETWHTDGLRCEIVGDAAAGDEHALSELIRSANR